MNVYYFQAMGSRLTWRRTGLDWIVMAGSGSSAIGVLPIWKNSDAGIILWSVIAGIAAIAAVTRKVSKLDERVSTCREVAKAHELMDYSLEVLTHDIKIAGEYNTDFAGRLRELLLSKGKVFTDVLEPIDRGVQYECTSQVLTEMPMSGLYVPP